jgi:hypothetical protein
MLKIPASSIARLSKIYPNLDFWFENIPSGNTETRPRPEKGAHLHSGDVFLPR